MLLSRKVTERQKKFDCIYYGDFVNGQTDRMYHVLSHDTEKVCHFVGQFDRETCAWPILEIEESIFKLTSLNKALVTVRTFMWSLNSHNENIIFTCSYKQ